MPYTLTFIYHSLPMAPFLLFYCNLSIACCSFSVLYTFCSATCHVAHSCLPHPHIHMPLHITCIHLCTTCPHVPYISLFCSSTFHSTHIYSCIPFCSTYHTAPATVPFLFPTIHTSPCLLPCSHGFLHSPVVSVAFYHYTLPQPPFVPACHSLGHSAVHTDCTHCSGFRSSVRAWCHSLRALFSPTLYTQRHTLPCAFACMPAMVPTTTHFPPV